MTSSYLTAVKAKRCQSKKNIGSGGCGDPKCPQGVAIKNALDFAIATSDFVLFEEVKQLAEEHTRNDAINSLIEGEISVRPQEFQGWTIAPEGMSGWFCKKCKYQFSHVEAGKVERDLKKCPNCSIAVTAESLGRQLLPESVEYFDEANVRKASWFHATTRDDWMESLSSMEDAPLVHLGSQVSSVMRARDLRDDLYRPRGNEWVVYETRVKASANFNQKVNKDDDQEFPYYVSDMDNPRNGYGTGVIRYVNGFEHPGSMSLLARPEDIEVVNVHFMDAAELDSWYSNWIKDQESKA